VVACDLHAPALDVEAVVGTLPEPERVVRHETQRTPPSPLDELAPREWFALLEPDRPISDYDYARCPLHDDHIPSLKLYDEPRDGWYCWACARGGDLIEYAAWRWDARPGGELEPRDFRHLIAQLQTRLGGHVVPCATNMRRQSGGEEVDRHCQTESGG
jgi:hypothetical protein